MSTKKYFYFNIEYLKEMVILSGWQTVANFHEGLSSIFAEEVLWCLAQLMLRWFSLSQPL